MRSEALPHGRTPVGNSTLDHAAVLLFALLSVVYFAQAGFTAAQAPFWMDEILTLWTARLPDVASIWSALVHGAEFTPALYDCFIHVLQQIGINSAFGLRLPSIVAIYVAAVATGAIAYRHAGVAPAALAAGVVLSSGLFGYAVQARPYAMVTAAFACALALYDQRQHLSNRRLAAIASLLALAIGLHFYALLLALGLGLLELLRAGKEGRAPSWRVLGAIALSGCSILLWLPILIAASAYSHGDVSAPGYYARPVLSGLFSTYAMLLGPLIVPLVGLFVATMSSPREKGEMRVTALVIGAAPLGVFLFALLVSHSYAERYALAGGIGIALLFASLVQQLGKQAATVSVVLIALLILATPWRSAGEVGKGDRLEALALVASVRDSLPIVTGSGLRFFEISENSPAGAHITFLDTPGPPSGDPTNTHQVLRWKAIDPRLRVESVTAFLCRTPAFYLFAQPNGGGADALPGWLAGRADFAAPPADHASLTLARAHRCPDRMTGKR
ncbi:hypothetical protein [Sphingomonas asaccharolytica]|uniref:hypothetical protein n=1 Tax=Sphingomonas asaccharolytica TaxID=40681 RepID=UPI0008359402|nr:hypothetical protein [Sphingomonas asaccharolytica]